MITELRQILIGIDKDKDHPNGWWETSKGAEFGSNKLKEVEELVEKITIQRVSDSLIKLTNQFLEDGDEFENKDVCGRYREVYVTKDELNFVHKNELR